MEVCWIDDCSRKEPVSKRSLHSSAVPGCHCWILAEYVVFWSGSNFVPSLLPYYFIMGAYSNPESNARQFRLLRGTAASIDSNPATRLGGGRLTSLGHLHPNPTKVLPGLLLSFELSPRGHLRNLFSRAVLARVEIFIALVIETNGRRRVEATLT